MTVEQTQLPAAPVNQACAAYPFPQMVFELWGKVAKLEARFTKYENAHTPPSLQEKNKVKPKYQPLPDRPKGYEGIPGRHPRRDKAQQGKERLKRGPGESSNAS